MVPGASGFPGCPQILHDICFFVVFLSHVSQRNISGLKLFYLDSSTAVSAAKSSCVYNLRDRSALIHYVEDDTVTVIIAGPQLPFTAKISQNTLFPAYPHLQRPLQMQESYLNKLRAKTDDSGNGHSSFILIY